MNKVEVDVQSVANGGDGRGDSKSVAQEGLDAMFRTCDSASKGFVSSLLHDMDQDAVCRALTSVLEQTDTLLKQYVYIQVYNAGIVLH